MKLTLSENRGFGIAACLMHQKMMEHAALRRQAYGNLGAVIREAERFYDRVQRICWNISVEQADQIREAWNETIGGDDIA